jgi:hypothetical protein
MFVSSWLAGRACIEQAVSIIEEIAEALSSRA